MEVFVACVIGGCETPTERSLSIHRVSPIVLWNRARNGFSLGIEQPQAPVVFEPTKNWTGPLVIVKALPSGVEMTSNPAGRWTENAVFTVYLRNDSKRPILWSPDYSDWHVVFTGSNAPKTESWPGGLLSPPSWGTNTPPRLEPGGQSRMLVRIHDTDETWPNVPPGKYTIVVSYSPTRYWFPAEGKREAPSRRRDFWTGTIETPAVIVEVEHPRKRR